jgi:hypothetical protein
MGTRSICRVIETYQDTKKDKKVSQTIVTMYRQFDGYPSGMGVDLVEFLKGSKVVNGLGIDEVKSNRVFNGAGCLAAQLVAHFKDGAGGIYLYPNTIKDCGQEYEYEIIVDFDTKNVLLKCVEIGYINKKGEYKNGRKVLFMGKPELFEQLIAEQE